MLKITRDELPMEKGVYGGCLLCPLYPLLTIAVLIRTVDSWKLAIDKGERVICTFLDLRKAFDAIDLTTLLDP